MSARLEPGMVIERFELERMLGSGAFGQVWLARDTRRDARVALKVLTRGDGPAIARFKRELRALGDLRHPNLVRVYELIRAEHRWLLSMELVPGRDLAEVSPDLERWSALLPQLVSALGALHAASVAHRDLKPRNIRITDEGRLVLLDFGLVAAFHDDREQDAAGSPLFMAPEQAAGGSPIAASDWYALGVMLFTAAARRPPFDGRALSVLVRKRLEPAPHVLEVAPIPSAWAALVDQLLLRDPEERMRGLSERLRTVCPSAPPIAEPAPAPPLVGRAEERRMLEEMLDDAFASKPGAACLVGPSGIGKTALLDWLCARAVERGALVLRGRCFEQERLPHAGLDALVDDLAAELSHHDVRADPSAAEAAALLRIFPVLEPVVAPEAWAQHRSHAAIEPRAEPSAVDGPSLRRYAASGLRRLLTSAAGTRPIVLVVDDTQWGDRDSAWLLAQCLSARRVLLVTASRRRSGMIEELSEAASACGVQLREHVLGPLEPEEAASLVAAYRRDASGVVIERLRRQGGGHPFFLVELARHAGGETGDLDAVLRRRLDDLDARERTLLLALALTARPLETSVAVRALDAFSRRRDGNEAVLHGLTGLRSARWITSPRGRLELSHDRLREAVRAAADEHAIRRLHAALDDALEHEGIDDPERQALHALGAGRRERAVSALIEAARRAHAALAFHRSADLYARALEHGDERDARWLELSAARARALADAGRSAEAAQVYASILRAYPATRGDGPSVEIARRCAEQFFHAGRPSEGYAALRDALRAAALPAPRGPARTFASLVSGYATLRARGLALTRKAHITAEDALRIETSYSAAIALSNMDSFRGVDYVLRSIELARAAGDAYGFARGIAMLANYACHGGTRTEPRARWILAGAERWAGALDAPYLHGLVEGARVLLAFHTGRYEASLRHAERASAVFESIAGCTREWVTADIYRLVASVSLGRFVHARAHWTQLLEDGAARRDRFALTNARSGLPNLLWLADGAPERARREAERAIEAWGESGFHVQHFFDLVARARIDLYQGKPRDALDRIERTRKPLARSLLTRMQFVRLTFWDLEARACLQAASQENASSAVERRVRRASARIRAERAGWSRPMADAIDAGLAALRGDRVGAISSAALAGEGYRRADMDAHARAVEHLARRLRSEATAEEWPDVADPDRFALTLAC